MSERLTHLDEQGRARMIDVGDKDATVRVAVASARLRMSPATAAAVRDGSGPKGEVLAAARLAGIGAAKRTAELIPLAHPLPLSFVDVVATIDVPQGIVSLRAEARTTAQTGVEMEAMTAAAIAALTVYDMVKGVERGVTVEEVVLLEKHGGRSDYVRGAPDPAGAMAAGRPGTGDAGVAAPRSGAGVVTISTSKAAGEGVDDSGPRLRALAERLGLAVVAEELVSDDRGEIEKVLRRLADVEGCALVLTSGGTGVAPTDVTPEATRAVVETEVDGLAEAMRLASRPHTANWMLSRGLAGVRGATLIVNLPGSPRSIEQIGEEIATPLAHALALIAGEQAPHGGEVAPASD